MVKNVSPEIKKKIGKEDLVPVMNVFFGELIYINEFNGFTRRWSEYGTRHDIPYSELQNMQTQYPIFIRNPWIYILDKKAIGQLELTDFYKTLLNPNEIDEFYKKDDTYIVSFLRATTHDMRMLIVNLTKHKIKDGTLRDLFKVRLIEETINEIHKSKSTVWEVKLLEEE